VHILYHDDFDGLASAALLAVVLRDNAQINRCTFSPVDHDPVTRAGWLKNPLDVVYPFSVVDFCFHPGAFFWVDHHSQSTFASPDYFEQYSEAQPSERWIWRRTTSCARLIAETFAVPSYLDPLVQVADDIDQARYPDAEAYFHGTSAALKIHHAWRLLSAGQKTDIACQFLTGDVHRGALLVESEYRQAYEQLQQGLARTPEHLQRTGNVVVCDLLDTGVPFVRFASYYYHPSASYALTAFMAGGTINISLNKNPWLDTAHYDLGEIARASGGGGHPYAAGITFGNAGQARQFIARVVHHLNQPFHVY
jgi:hypothetical protein